MAKPKIRFKGYQDDWEQRKLGDTIIEYKETADSDCTLPILTSSKTEGVILQEEHFGRKQQHDITGYNILPRNYCTYRNRSDGVDFTFNINKCCDKGIISKFYPVFSGKNSDVFFLSLVLNNSDEVVREIAYTCTGTGQKVLSFLDLQKMKVRAPRFDEQKEIAAYFENLDHLITLHQRKCEEVKKLKKFMLQKMFPQNGSLVPKIRFDGFTDDWEQRKVSEIGNIITGSTPKTSISDNYGGEFLFVSPADIQGNRYVDETITTLTKKGFDQGRKIRERASLFVSIGSTIGKVAQTSQESTTNQQINAVEPYDNFDDDFIFTSLENISGSIKAIASNQAVPIVNKTTFGETEIQVPSELAEQQKIGAYFRNLDHLITLHQQKCDDLKNLKKYMLQNMFI